MGTVSAGRVLGAAWVVGVDLDDAREQRSISFGSVAAGSCNALPDVVPVCRHRRPVRLPFTSGALGTVLLRPFLDRFGSRRSALRIDGPWLPLCGPV